MPATLPFQNQCCTPCDDIVTVNVPGATGNAGTDGTNGTNGTNAFTNTTASYLQPAAAATVEITVNNSSWAVIGQHVFVQGGGHYTVTAKASTTKMTIQNLDYSDSAAAAATIAAGAQVGPSGHVGASGTTSGAAGGDLKDTYPNPTISLANTKGAIIAGDGSDCQTLSVGGTNGHRLRVNSAAALGVDWAVVDLSNGGGFTDVANALAIGNGGTGQTTANPAFNALSPVTTRGDLIYRNATVNARLALGASGTVVTSDGTDPVWAKIGTTNLDTTVGRSPVNVYIAKHALADGTDGGASTNGSWLTRPLNVESVNTIGGGASLAANQITLPAGTYRVEAWSAVYRSDMHRCGVYNVTDGAWATDTTSGDEIVGPASDSEQSGNHQTIAAVVGRFTIGASKALELRYRVETSQLTNGLGLATTWGTQEVYAMVKFEQEAL